ncbi:hypothetical protein BGX28_010430 [Mortierella sp. GBA30]|nr:hypothetical protein BGX28_010430 [Mortierella sp. GBA30]
MKFQAATILVTLFIMLVLSVVNALPIDGPASVSTDKPLLTRSVGDFVTRSNAQGDYPSDDGSTPPPKDVSGCGTRSFFAYRYCLTQAKPLFKQIKSKLNKGKSVSADSSPIQTPRTSMHVGHSASALPLALVNKTTRHQALEDASNQVGAGAMTRPYIQ